MKQLIKRFLAWVLGLTVMLIVGAAGATVEVSTESFEAAFCSSGATCSGQVTTTSWQPPAGARALALYAGGEVSWEVDTSSWQSAQATWSWLSYGQTTEGEALEISFCASPSDCVVARLTDTVPSTILWEESTADITSVVGGALTVTVALTDSGNMSSAPDRAFADAITLTGNTAEPAPPPAPPPADPALDGFDGSDLQTSWVVRAGSDPDVANGDLVLGNQWAVIWWDQDFTDDQFAEITIPADVAADSMVQVFVRGVENGTRRYAFGCYPGPEGPDQWYVKFDGLPSNETRIMLGAPCTVDPGAVWRVEARNSPDDAWVWVTGYADDVEVIHWVDVAENRSLTGQAGIVARTRVGASQDVGGSVAAAFRAGSLE